MSGRRSIEVPGLHHGGVPIPLASLHRGLLMSSGIAGMDPATGTVPAALDEQVALVFANVERILAAAGGTLDDIVKLTFFARDRKASRQHIDEHWTRLFPDAATRPARHTLAYALPDPMLVQAELVAALSEVPE